MPEITETPEVKEKTKAAKAPRKYKITIHSEGSSGDAGDVLLGHNFRLLQIKRDVPVEIDEYFLEVLKSSMIDTQAKDENDKMKPVKIPRYNYTVEQV